MRPIILSVAVVTSVLALTACSSGGGSSEQSTSNLNASNTTSFCTSYCEKVSSCDSSNDLQTCSESCEDTIRQTFDKARSDVVDGIRTCWDASDCRMILSGARLGECVDEASVSVAPTASAKAFCGELAGALEKCDSLLDYADCLATVKVYSDETIAKAKKCTTKSCSTIMTCVEATL